MADIKILIVEDEEITKTLLKVTLEKQGYIVCDLVSSGEDAIQKTAEKHPDLVLMDILLKGDMDGIEAAEHIRKRFHIPIVYVTAYSDTSTLRRAKITKPFGYIVKPFESKNIQAVIEMALYKHELERQLEQSEIMYRSLFEQSNDAIIIHDPYGKIFNVNQKAEQLLGYSKKELPGKTLAELHASTEIDMFKKMLTKCMENVYCGNRMGT